MPGVFAALVGQQEAVATLRQAVGAAAAAVRGQPVMAGAMILADSGIRTVLTGVQVPRMNSLME